MDIANIESLFTIFAGFIAAVIAAAAWLVVRKKALRSPQIFEALAQAFRCPIVTSQTSERFFNMNVHNRDFRIAKWRLTGGGSATALALGARGDQLAISIRLNASAWQMHRVVVKGRVA